MKPICKPSIVGLVLAVLSPPLLRAEDDPKKETKPDPDALAKKLITQCARVKDGDIVQISGGVRDIELLESLIVEAARLGADTLLLFSPSDRTVRRLYINVPAKYDSRISPLALKLAETVTVTIGVDSTESAGFLADMPGARLSARVEAN
jgi:hypothetical protein